MPPLARTLTDRLSRSLSAGAAAALAAVAAAGRIGVAEALEVLNDLADPAAALDAAVLAGVVVETGDRLSAAHPLIGAAAVESAPAGSPRAALPAAGRGLVQPGAVRALHRAGRRAGTGRARSPRRWTRPRPPRTPGPPTPRPRSSPRRRCCSRPASDADALVRRRIRAARAALPGRRHANGHWSTWRRSTSASSATEDLERALPLLTDLAETVPR